MDTDWLWRRWPLLLAAIAWLVFLAGLAPDQTSVPAPAEGARASESGVLELEVEATPACSGGSGSPCSQRGEPPTAARPIAGAAARFWRSEVGPALPQNEAHTDAAGRARLELQKGSYWLLVSAAGRARWSGSVELAQPLQSLRIALAPAVPLRVTVRGGDGRLLPGALVWVYGEELVPQAAVSSELGEVSFTEVGERIESLRVSAPGHAPVHLEPSSRDVSVQLSSPSSVLVSVLDEAQQPASGAEVWLSGLDVWPPRQSRAGTDGTVVWEGLASGTYDLRAQLSGGVASASLTLERGERRALSLLLVQGRSVQVLVSEGALGGAPIAGAEVVLVEEGLGPFPLQGITDAQGMVTLGPLPPGGATVSARARGFMPESAVPVSSDSSRIQLALTRGARIQGRVVDASGRPVAGASLEVLGTDLRGQPIARRAWLDPLSGASDRSRVPLAPLIPLGELGVLKGPLPVPGGALSSALRSAWISDDAGDFRLEDVPPGRIRVLARHPDYVEARSAELELGPAAEGRIRLELQRGATLRGRILEAGGEPVARARIDAQGRHALQQASALSHEDGSFEFRSVASDVDLFVARPSDRQRFVLRKSLQLAAGEAYELELVLPPERPAFEVLVLADDQRPLEGAVVSVVSLDPAAPLRRSLSSDVTGRARFADAAGLGLALRVQASGFGHFETRLEAAPPRVEVSLQLAVRVSGRVTHVRGRQGLPDAQVVWIQGGERRSTRTDARGEFQLGEVSPGQARVSVSHPGFAPRLSDLSIPSMGPVDRQFELAPIDLVEAGSVSGRVLDADGEPVQGARVGVGLVPAFVPAGSDPVGLVHSDGAGQFRLDEVPVGRVTVSAYAAGAGRGRLEGIAVRAGETAGPIEIWLYAPETDPEADALASVAITLGERPSGAGVEVVIVNVAAGSEAERADLREGDIVRAVDGWEVSGMSEARRYLGGADSSDVIIELDRDGEWLSLNVRREAVTR